MIFFSNPKITSDKLIEPHYQQTAERIKRSNAKYVLALQDQMRLNYTSHPAKTELGRIGKSGKTEQYGLIQHSVLCVTDKNEPLGLMNVKLFDYEDFDTDIHQHHRSIKDKATRYWIDALVNMRQRLGECQQRIITVADREGDFYEFLHELIVAKAELHSSRETIKNLIAMASISACRLYWLIYIGRTEAAIKADQLFEDFEWKAIYVYFKEKIPQECPMLSEVILRIARLGGYKFTKKGQPPGIKTMWIGFQQFTIAAQMYRNMTVID